MPVISANGQPDYTNWKVIKRELAALDILSSPHIVIPEEFVKTKHHCYLVKEYVNGGTLSQLLLYRSQVNVSEQRKKRLSEQEMQIVMTSVINALKDVYELGFAIWDLSPETLLLDIGLAFEITNA